jgi:hypothetical protein
MAANYTLDTFKIYDDLFNQAYIETLTQQVNVFNEASNGMLVLTTESIKGNFQKKAIFKELATSAIIKHRDPSSVAQITAETLDQIEQIGVKINRYSFIQKTADAFAKLAMDPNTTFSQVVGTATAMAQAEDHVNTLLAALTGAIGSDTAMVIDKSTAKIDFKDINEARFKFGDKYQSVRGLVMHSSVAKDLADLNIDEKLSNVAGLTIQTGNFAHLGLPIVITDSPELVSGGVGSVFALTAEAGVIIDSETPRAYTQIDVTTENTMLQLKRETAANLLVKGYSYTGTGVSPTNADLKDTTKWASFATDAKNRAGVLLKVKVA